MRRLLLTGLILLSAQIAYPQTSRFPLRTTREGVTQLYEVISESDRATAKAIYQSLTVDVQSDLWTIQLEELLLDAPAMTPEQRAITMEALGLLTSGVLQQTTSVDQADQAQAAIADLAARAALVFTRSGRAIFGDLGRSAVMTSASSMRDLPAPGFPRKQRVETAREGATTSGRPNRVTVNADCECNTAEDQDFCFQTPTSPINDCRRLTATACTRTTCCCGWFWREPCNGLCWGE
jgi:hypothetical protein